MFPNIVLLWFGSAYVGVSYLAYANGLFVGAGKSSKDAGSSVSNYFLYSESVPDTRSHFIDILKARIPIGAMRIETGFYVGTGGFDSRSENELSFDFIPKLLFVWGPSYDRQMFAGRGMASCVVEYNDSDIQISWDKNKVSWYHEKNAEYQLNKKNCEYRYLALG